MKDRKEEVISKENENDIFKCDSCKNTATRKEIRKKWLSIPFGNEEKKRYYCGCMGWN